MPNVLEITSSNIPDKLRGPIGEFLDAAGLSARDACALRVLDDHLIEVEVYLRDEDGDRYADPRHPYRAASEVRRVRLAQPFPESIRTRAESAGLLRPA